MTEVWKSVPKKYCKMCKCWFYDNKASIQHHEQGSRHKFNVRNKLHELGEKRKEREWEDKETKYALAQMELGALRSYKKDLKESPGIANNYNIHLNLSSLPIGTGSRSYFPATSSHQPQQPHLKLSAGVSTTWLEVRCPDDPERSYFYNPKMGISKWEAPDEGYLSIAEQQMATEMEAASAAGSSSWYDETPEEPADQQEDQAESSFTRGDEEVQKPSGYKKKKIDKEEGSSANQQEQVASNEPLEEEGEVQSTVPKYSAPFGQWEVVETSSWNKKGQKKQAEVEEVVEEDSDDDEKMKKFKFEEKKCAPSKAALSKPVQFKKRNVGTRNLRVKEDD